LPAKIAGFTQILTSFLAQEVLAARKFGENSLILTVNRVTSKKISLFNILERGKQNKNVPKIVPVFLMQLVSL
jgi:hypothetical protein